MSFVLAERKACLEGKLSTIVVYFDQRLGAAPPNAGQNQWKMQNAGIFLKFN